MINANCEAENANLRQLTSTNWLSTNSNVDRQLTWFGKYTYANFFNSGVYMHITLVVFTADWIVLSLTKLHF